MTETRSTQKSHNGSCLVTSPNHSPKKNAEQITLGWSWHTHKKAIKSISEVEIIGRLNFFETTHFRIVHLCKERESILSGAISPFGNQGWQNNGENSLCKLQYINSDLLPAGSAPSEIAQALYVCQLGKTYTLFSCLPSFLYLLLALQQKVKEKKNYWRRPWKKSLPNIPDIFSA